MVVAEDGRAFVGQQVTLTLTSTLQTSAGRLLFGRVVEGREPEPPAAEPAPNGEETEEVAAAPSGGGVPGPVHVPPPEAERPGPYPPKPPNKRVNPFRNPRR
jgi:hypothetical protein